MTPNNALMNAALAYAMRGWPVFPCDPKTKRPLLRRDKDKDGNDIPDSGGVKKASTNPDYIRAWWTMWPKAAIAVALGREAGVFVLDLDVCTDKETGEVFDLPKLYARFEAELGVKVPEESWVSASPRGGRHHWFEYPLDDGDFINRVALFGKHSHIDIRANGGYVLVPPSMRNDGVPYQWIRQAATKDERPAKAPQELLDCILRRGKWEAPFAAARATAASQDDVTVTRDGRLDGGRSAEATAFKRDVVAADDPIAQAGEEAVRKYALVAFDDDIRKLKASVKGQRNDDLFHTSIRLAQLVACDALDKDMALRELHAVAQTWPSYQKSKGTIESGWRKGLAEPRDLRDIRLKGEARARRYGADARETTSGREAAGPSDRPASAGFRPPDPPPPEFSDFDRATLPPARQHSRTGDKPHGAVRAGGEGRRKPPAVNPREFDRRCAFFPMTDLGNAERFATRYAGRLLFCPAIGWLWWDGKRWATEGAEGKVKVAEHDTVRSIQDEAEWVRKSDHNPVVHIKYAGTDREEEITMADALAAWGRTSEDNRRLTPIAKRAAPYLEVSSSELDADPFAINVNNGTLRIVRHGKTALIEFHDHAPEDYITKLAPVDYDPDARCPEYDGFLEMVQPSAGMRRFLNQWGGYSATGDASEQVLTFNHGKGKNGKSTLFNIWGLVLGDYGRSIRIETFLDQQGRSRAGGAPTPDLAALAGIRFLRTSEPERGAKLAEALIKLATGCEPMSVRFLNREFFDMIPVFKLTMSGNYKPTITGTDEGIWRRVRLVPWSVEVPKDKRVKDFDKVMLWPERSGILNALLAGAIDWCEHGLVEPDEVIKATEEYRSDSDPLGRFLSTCTIIDPEGRVQASELHKVFVAWCTANGEREWKGTGFGRAMRERGYASLHSDVNWWVGIRLVKTINDFVDRDGIPLKAGARASDNEEDDDIVPA